MQIPINKEIRHYQEELFLRLNLRQMICSGAAIAVAVAVYLGLTLLLGHETPPQRRAYLTHLNRCKVMDNYPEYTRQLDDVVIDDARN